MRIKLFTSEYQWWGRTKKREEGKSNILTERGLAGVMELRRNDSNSSSTSTMMMHRVRCISLWNIPISTRHWKNISTGSDGWTDMTSSFTHARASSIREITFRGLLNKHKTWSGSFYNLNCDQSKQKKKSKIKYFSMSTPTSPEAFDNNKNPMRIKSLPFWIRDVRWP